MHYNYAPYNALYGFTNNCYGYNTL